MSGLWLISYIVLWILFLLTAFVLLSVLHNLGTVYEILKHVPPNIAATKLIPGQKLPELVGQTISGQQHSLSAFRGKPTVYIIISPQCSTCHAVLQDIEQGTWTPPPSSTTTQALAIVSIGNIPATTEMLRQIAFSSTHTVVVVPIEHMVKSWGITRTPTIFLTDEQQTIVGQVLEGYPIQRKGGEEDSHEQDRERQDRSSREMTVDMVTK